MPYHRAASAICKQRPEWDALQIYENVQTPELWQHQMLVRRQSSRTSHSHLTVSSWRDKHWKSLVASHLIHTLQWRGEERSTGKQFSSVTQKQNYLHNAAVTLFGIYAKEINPKSTQNLYMNVYSRFINNCQNLELIRIYFSRWMGKLCSIQTIGNHSGL